MTISFFLTFLKSGEPDARVSAAELARVGAILSGAPGLRRAVIFTPDAAHDPHLDDGPPPLLAMQIYVAEMAALKAVLAPLEALASARDFPGLAGAEAIQEAMQARRFEVPDPAPRTPRGAPLCTYLVRYDGAAEEPEAWHAHFTAHHVPLMARLPGVREVELYTPLEWPSALPWRRARHFQRNKVVFDDAAALTAALHSPIRYEMRADFHRFPRFHGRVVHHPMATRVIVP